MKVTVVGAGAIGGLMAARIAAQKAVNPDGPLASVELSVLARGATLARLNGSGLALFEPLADSPGEFDKTFEAPIHASDSPADLGPQDLIIIALKYNAMNTLAPQLAPMVGPDTVILSAMNGVPWWFTTGLQGAPAGLAVPTVDPGGVISDALPVKQVIGCVVHLAASTRGPGQIQHNLGNRLVIGEPNGQMTARLAQVASLLKTVGFDVEPTNEIHAAVWYKLWGNMTVNPISAITGAWSDAILADPLLRGFISAVMREAALVGEKIGLPIAEDPESRHRVTAKLGAFKSSMLQDAEAGKPIELDALVTVVREIAQQVEVPTPHTDALLGMTRVFAQTHKLN